MSIKDLPKDERPYEKCEKFGPGVLSDAELLAIILKSGNKELSAIELARNVIERSGPCGIVSLCGLDYDTLLKIDGIGKSKAVSILCLGEIARRFERSEFRSNISFDSSGAVAKYYMNEFRYLDKEVLGLVCLDNKNHLIKKIDISVGTVNYSVFSVRELIKEALSYNAVSVILIHNHPSGDPNPSTQDVDATKNFEVACKICEINLLDHIIIGDNKYFSMKAKGLL